MNTSVLLVNPKTPYNVGAAIRACSIFGVNSLRWTGDRIDAADARRKAGSLAYKDRLPREERLKDYTGVRWQGDAREPAAICAACYDDGCVPVAVDLLDGAEDLPHFVHPAQALYVFGPEDGTIGKATLAACHRFLRIPSRNRTPLNLAAAVNIVLYDRMVKDFYES